MTIDELIDAWRANEAINKKLLRMCSDADLELKPGKGKTVRNNFTHIIACRRAWAAHSLPEQANGIKTPDARTATRKQIEHGLEKSSKVMEDVFRKISKKPGRGKWAPLTFLAYTVAHDACHRSQIEIALRINDREPSENALGRLWNWTESATTRPEASLPIGAAQRSLRLR